VAIEGDNLALADDNLATREHNVVIEGDNLALSDDNLRLL
jgi:hypothetical protein